MRHKRTITASLLCILLVGVVVARRHWRSTHSIAARYQRAALDVRIAELDLNNVSLQAAVDQLSRLTGAHVQISDELVKDLQGDAASGRPPIRARLRNVKLSVVLDLLAAMSRPGEGASATWELRPDGTFLILPSAAVQREMRVYDVRDLMDRHHLDGEPQSLELAIESAVNPAGRYQLSGRWAYVATPLEHGQIAGILAALRSRSETVDQSDKTADALGQWVGAIADNGASLPDRIDALAEQAGINIVVDWPALLHFFEKTDGEHIPIDFRRLPLRNAINLLLSRTMTYCACDNVLFVTPKASPSSFRQVRAYEVDDLFRAFRAELCAADATSFQTKSEPSTEPGLDQATAAIEDVLHTAALRSIDRGDVWAGWWDSRFVLAGPAESHCELRRVLSVLREFSRASTAHRPANPQFFSDNEEAFSRLNTRVKEVALYQASLPDALAILRFESGVAIGINGYWPVGVSRSTRSVTLHLWNVPVAVALHEVLKAASDKRPLNYGISQGVVLVSDEPSLWMTTRIYDVGDIVQHHSEELHRLATLLRACTEGVTLSIRSVGNWLVVTDTPENHLRISSLLKSLRSHGPIDAGGLWPDD